MAEMLHECQQFKSYSMANLNYTVHVHFKNNIVLTPIAMAKTSRKYSQLTSEYRTRWLQMSFVHLMTLCFKFRFLVCLKNKTRPRCMLACFHFLHRRHFYLFWPVVKKTTVIVFSIIFFAGGIYQLKRDLRYKEPHRRASILLLWMHGHVYTMLTQKEIHSAAFSSTYVILWLKRPFISSAISSAFETLISSDKTQPSHEFYWFYLLKLCFLYTVMFKNEIATADS